MPVPYIPQHVCYSGGVMLCLCLTSHNMPHILYDLGHSLNIYIKNKNKTIGVRLWCKKREAILKGIES